MLCFDLFHNKNIKQLKQLRREVGNIIKFNIIIFILISITSIVLFILNFDVLQFFSNVLCINFFPLDFVCII